MANNVLERKYGKRVISDIFFERMTSQCVMGKRVKGNVIRDKIQGKIDDHG